MGFFDIFSDQNEQDAADKLSKGYKEGYKESKKQLGKGYEGLKKSYASGLEDIQTGLDTGTGYVTGGLATGRGDITGARDTALGYYDPYVAATEGAAGLYANALGLGGASGTQAAQNAFQVSPGYDFAMDQGLQALDRTAASRGMLSSGNTDIDTLTYAQGLADQEYGNWLDDLFAQQTFGADIAGARSNITTGAGSELAGLEANAATELANMATNAGTQKAAINTGKGDVKYGYRTDLGNLGYATALGQAGAEADYLANKDATGANVFGAVTGAGSLGASLLGLK